MIKTYWITVNRLCQLRCKWCYAHGTKYLKKDDANINTLFRLVDIMSEINVATCKILGGEPAIYSHIIPLLNYLREKNVKSVMISNGLAYENMEIVKKHFDAGLLLLIVSLKTGSAEGYKNWTGKNVYRMVLKAIENLSLYNSGVSITVTNVNSKEIIRGIADCISAGVRFINIDFCTTVFVSGRPIGDYMPDANMIQTIVPEVTEYLKGSGIKFNIQLSLPFCLFEPKFVFDLFKEKHAMSGCIARKKSGIVFGVNGEAGFCNHLLDFPFGKLEIDFKTGKQLEDLYYSQTEFFKQTNRVPDIRCKFCSISSLCCGGCPVKWTSYKPKDFIKGGDSFLAMEQQFRSLVSL